MYKCINPLSLSHPKPWHWHVVGLLHELHLFFVDRDAAFTANCTSQSEFTMFPSPSTGPCCPRGGSLPQQPLLSLMSPPLQDATLGGEGEFLMEKPFPPHGVKGTSPASRWVPHVWEPGARKWEPLGIQGHPLVLQGGVPSGKSCWRAQQGPGQSQDKLSRDRRGWPAASGALCKVLLSPASFSGLWLSKPVFTPILRLDPFSQTALTE